MLLQGLNSLSFGTNEYSRRDEVKLKSPEVKMYRLRSDEKEEKKDYFRFSEAARSLDAETKFQGIASR